MPLKIKTAGDLRQVLCETIEGVLEGTVETKSAAQVTRLSSQINASLFSELKVRKMELEAKRNIGKIGETAIF